MPRRLLTAELSESVFLTTTSDESAPFLQLRHTLAGWNVHTIARSPCAFGTRERGDGVATSSRRDRPGVAFSSKASSTRQKTRQVLSLTRLL